MPPVDVNRLKDRRAELDLSNQSIADRMKTSEAYVRNLMCGADDPSLRMIYKLSRALNLPVDEITAGRRTPQGVPSGPPIQPKNEPKGPPKRQDKEPTKAPKRARDQVA